MRCAGRESNPDSDDSLLLERNALDGVRERIADSKLLREGIPLKSLISGIP